MLPILLLVIADRTHEQGLKLPRASRVASSQVEFREYSAVRHYMEDLWVMIEWASDDTFEITDYRIYCWYRQHTPLHPRGQTGLLCLEIISSDWTETIQRVVLSKIISVDSNFLPSPCVISRPNDVLRDVLRDVSRDLL